MVHVSNESLEPRKTAPMKPSDMSAQTLSFQAPTSLAGTLAAYEARRKSASASPASKELASVQHEIANRPHLPAADQIYQRTLPSLHFLRWRPLYHLQAPSGWMNDPCAPGYDPTTGLYHLFFQWNPKRNVYGAVAWGQISWGHATSKDMTNWTVSGTATLKPGSWYDKEGCFTGCMVPTGLNGQPGQITLFYTGVSRLPLHYTLPYQDKTETLVVAQSTDGGQHFTKVRNNPIQPQPPSGYSVTGWRDPYVAQWSSMDVLLNREPGQTLYGMISGGIRDRTPTAFVYAVNPENLTQWVFLNAIVDVGINHNISRWSGDMGINWECGSFMTLTSEVDGSSREFIVVGGEGSDTHHPNSTFTEHPQQLTKFPRAERSLQWMSGSLETSKNENGDAMPELKYISGGRFDHAQMYGVNTFHDVKSGQQIAWGWITEEDLPQKLVDRQNWSGMLSIPRQLSLLCIKGVTGAMRSKLKEITSFEVEAGTDDTFTVRTLGISPARSNEALRRGTVMHELTQSQKLDPSGVCFLDVQTCRFELMASFAVSDKCSRIGLSIHHSQQVELESSTRITFTPYTETLSVDRPNSAHVDPEILSFAENAPFTLLTRKQANGSEVREHLEIRAFFDESVLEVFANDRCTFATRVYPNSKRCFGIRFWAEDDSGQSGLVGARTWDGLRADMRVAS